MKFLKTNREFNLIIYKVLNLLLKYVACFLGVNLIFSFLCLMFLLTLTFATGENWLSWKILYVPLPLSVVILLVHIDEIGKIDKPNVPKR